MSHSLPLFGCLEGTLRPSARQMRCTRLAFTCQPAICKKVGDAPVAVAAEAAGQSDDGRGQGVLIFAHLGLVALARAMLTQSLAGPAFGYMQPLTDCFYASAST